MRSPPRKLWLRTDSNGMKGFLGCRLSVCFSAKLLGDGLLTERQEPSGRALALLGHTAFVFSPRELWRYPSCVQ